MTAEQHTHPTGYIKQPTIALPQGESILTGDAAWLAVHETATQRAGTRPPVVVVDTYPGADLPAVIAMIRAARPDYRIIDVESSAALPIAEIDQRIAHNLTDDRVFGVISHATLDVFYDADRLAAVSEDIRSSSEPVVVVGWGAALAAPDADATVLVDMARWELQQRNRAGGTNWRCDNGSEDILRKYKRGFFVEWRVADRHKRELFPTLDFVLDGNAVGGSSSTDPGMITGRAFRSALQQATTSPLRVVPFFDPGVWGGQWMKDKLRPRPAVRNYAWCFDCVPEENTLLLEADGRVVEIPALDLVLSQPRRAARRKRSSPASARSSRSGSTFSTPWAAATSRSRSIR